LFKGLLKRLKGLNIRNTETTKKRLVCVLPGIQEMATAALENMLFGSRHTIGIPKINKGLESPLFTAFLWWAK
jgi:hypothetical protein